jgi:hypothetical protein
MLRFCLFKDLLLLLFIFIAPYRGFDLAFLDFPAKNFLDPLPLKFLLITKPAHFWLSIARKYQAFNSSST